MSPELTVALPPPEVSLPHTRLPPTSVVSFPPPVYPVQFQLDKRTPPWAMTPPWNVEVALGEVIESADAWRGPVKEEEAEEDTFKFCVELKLPPVSVIQLEEERPALDTPPAYVDVPMPRE